MFGSRKISIAVGLAAVSAVLAGCGSSAQHHGPARPDVRAVPQHLRWSVFQGVPVPEGDEGPHHIEGPVATGYDQSPAGAALAAIESSIRVAVANDAERAEVGRRLLAPGPGRDLWATERWQLSITDPVAPGAAPRVLGYVITGYTPAKAAVDIYTREVDGSIACTGTTVIRRGDDWLLAFPADPNRSSVSAVATVPRDLIALPQPGGEADR